LSKYGGVWQADAGGRQGDTLFAHESDHELGQKKRKLALDVVSDKENNIDLHHATQKELGTLHQNGGKSCHPKMRAKFMFRTGDFANSDWGYDWISSDNESVKETEHKEGIDYTDDYLDTEPKSSNRSLSERRFSLHRLPSEASSIASESTIPAIDDLESPTVAKEQPWTHPIPDLTSHVESFQTIREEDESMPTLTNETDNHTNETDDHTNETDHHDYASNESNPRLDTNVYVTEVTHQNLTVIIQESEQTKGFFKWQD
jgi:hypothetical protein